MPGRVSPAGCPAEERRIILWIPFQGWRRMRITQKEIARRMGISLITVSRALNNSGYVSQDLKTRILNFAKENNYVPHKASQILVRNKVRRIAVFSSSLPHYFWDDVRKGIDIAANQLQHFNYQINYHNLPEEDSETYIRLLKEEINKGLDGAALVNQRKYDMKTVMALLETNGIPYVTFNVDAAESKRLCHIGSDYRSGGRLAANFIGSSLRFKDNATVMILQLEELNRNYSENMPDINRERLKGFLEVMKRDYPGVRIITEDFTTAFRPGIRDDQIERILKEREGSVDAVYLIPAFNEVFLEALEKLDYRQTVTVLHDIDSTAIHHLETHLLTGVIYQNPILQGYYAIRTLEHILDSGSLEPRKNIEIINSLVLGENRFLFMNNYDIAQILD